MSEERKPQTMACAGKPATLSLPLKPEDVWPDGGHRPAGGTWPDDLPTQEQKDDWEIILPDPNGGG